jgi:putative ABC transport system permease protein
MLIIGYEELALGSVLVLLHAGISLYYRTGVATSMLVASVRMVVQLGLMAYVLRVLFVSTLPLWTMVAAAVMIGFAGYEVLSRQKRRIGGMWGYGIGMSSLFASAGIVTAFSLLVQVKPDPWYEARYAIPLLGMVLGNALNGVSLGLSTLTNTLWAERDMVEARLALGHNKWQACETVMRQSMHTGMMGIVNSMSGAGLVFIPGMMTGQLMAGADPLEAAKYQILIMFLIAGGTAIGTTSAVFMGIYRLTDQRHRLRLDRLSMKD